MTSVPFALHHIDALNKEAKEDVCIQKSSSFAIGTRLNC